MLSGLNPLTFFNSSSLFRYQTQINSGEAFFTFDGLQFLKRVATRLPLRPAPHSFYPSNGINYIQDTQNQLTVITDFSEGISSHKSGALELMMMRSAMQDDGRGMGQPMTDMSHLSSLHLLKIGGIQASHDTLFSAREFFENPIRLHFQITKLTLINCR